VNLPEGLHLLREPALLIAALLAPAVQTALLVWGGLSPAGQAVWNAVAAAVAGLVLAILAANDRLAPAIVGLATAVLALAAWYGWHLDARQQTEILSLVSLATGLFLRTQITAPIDAAGREVRPATAREKPNVNDAEERLWPYDGFSEKGRDGEEPPHYDTAEIPVADDVVPDVADLGADSSSQYAVQRPVELPEIPATPRTVAPIEGRRMSG
jgi:hypothetical protein